MPMRKRYMDIELENGQLFTHPDLTQDCNYIREHSPDLLTDLGILLFIWTMREFRPPYKGWTGVPAHALGTQSHMDWHRVRESLNRLVAWGLIKEMSTNGKLHRKTFQYRYDTIERRPGGKQHYDDIIQSGDGDCKEAVAEEEKRKTEGVPKDGGKHDEVPTRKETTSRTKAPRGREVKRVNKEFPDEGRRTFHAFGRAAPTKAHGLLLSGHPSKPIHYCTMVHAGEEVHQDVLEEEIDAFYALPVCEACGRVYNLPTGVGKKRGQCVLCSPVVACAPQAHALVRPVGAHVVKEVKP